MHGCSIDSSSKLLRTFPPCLLQPVITSNRKYIGVCLGAPYKTLPTQAHSQVMSGPSKYLLVSLPTSISPSSDQDEALTALRSTVTTDNGTVLPFKIPEFKIGTLDALVQQADDLAKLESSCEAVVAKIGDSLRSLLEGDEDKIAQQKTVNDSRCGTL